MAATWLFLGLFALGAFGRCGSAEAAEFIHLVNKVELEAGKTKGLELGSVGANYKFESPGSLNIECKFMLVLNGSYVAGGKPGVSFMTLEWTSCNGSSKGKACQEIEVSSPPLRGEIVERTVGGSSGNASTALSPAEGEQLINFKLKCEGQEEERAAKGSVQAEPSSQCSNLEEIGYSMVGFSEKVISSKGGEETIAASLEGGGLFVTGWSKLKLSDKSTWGVR